MPRRLVDDALVRSELPRVGAAAACLPDKPYSEMTPEELCRVPVKVDVASTATVTFGGGLKVNGVALPNTPVV